MVAKGPASLQSRKYPGEKRLNKSTVKCGGLRFRCSLETSYGRGLETNSEASLETREDVRIEGVEGVIGENCCWCG